MAAASEQTTWKDATKFLEAVCSEMAVGELLHGENFSLYEAMSALEIMDPKMDAGMATGGVKTVEEAIARGAAPLDLTIPQLIDVLDQLLACEATWHSGHSLAQTVFSCLYLHKPERTAPNVILHAFCKAVRSTCNLSRTLVCIADVQEEEDFVVATFGFPLGSEPDGKGLAALNALEELLSRQLKAAKGGAGKKREGGDVEPLQEDAVLEEAYCEQLLSRLRFRKAFHNVLTNMDKPQLRGIDLARKHITSALKELALLRISTTPLKATSASPESPSTIHLKGHTAAPTAVPMGGTSVATEVAGTGREEMLDARGELGGAYRSTASGRGAIGFDESCNRRLLAPTPPRPITILSWEETLAHFEKLLSEFERVCLVGGASSLLELQQYVVDFDLGHPGAVARARLQVTLFPDEKVLGRTPLWEMVLDALHIPKGPLRADADVIGFASRAARPMRQLFRILCLNPARQRRKLARVLPEWDTLIHEAEFTIEAPAVKEWLEKAYPDVQQGWWKANVFTSWTIAQTCRIMLLHLVLGFEQDLYSTQEHLMIYWFPPPLLLRPPPALTFVGGCLLRGWCSGRYMENLLHTLMQVLRLTDKRFEEEKGGDGRKKGVKKKGGKSSVGQNVELCKLQLWSHLCRAMIRLLAALTLAGRLPPLEPPFNTEEERYEQRFAALHKVHCPEPLPYSHFRDSTDTRHFTALDLYESSAVCLREARAASAELAQALAVGSSNEATSIERPKLVAEAKQLEQVLQRNEIALSILRRLGPKDKLQVSFEFSHHHCFPVTVVKKPDKVQGVV